ncbi:MAG: DUF5009 domain-containing protein [Acidobacteria bacterium]|nr:DUF5009 domain-containing protein [Acidobacteriota bacterium]
MSEIARTIDSDVVSTTISKPKRMLSLDVLRGLTIGFMILVNNQTGGGPFHPLTHAKWNGFTPTDLVFPTFLFLVGISTVLSTAARKAKGESSMTLFLHTLRRAALLFVFGLVVNNFPFFHIHTARIYGVLPRIAICYLIVATLYLISPTWKDKVVIAVACLVGYWALMRFVPVPGFGVPTHDIPINDMNGNLTAYIDRHIFGASHLYEKVRDPEGLLSTIPSIATTLFGLLTGLWLRTKRAMEVKMSGIAIAGTLMVCAGAAWNFSFPINKKLWTSSFALFAGGWSLLLLALAIYIIDVRRIGRADVTRADAPEHPTIYKPLLVFGTNAILAYMVSELGDSILHNIHPAPGDTLKKMLYRAVFSVVHHTGFAALIYSLVFTLVCWLIVYPFYRKRIFLKI